MFLWQILLTSETIPSDVLVVSVEPEDLVPSQCAFLQGDLDEQRVDDDDDDDNSKFESAPPVSGAFCEPDAGQPRKLQLEHHQCFRLLKAVYGLVNAPRRLYHRVANDLRNLTGEESVMELVCVLSEMKTVLFILCASFTSMISCWRAMTLHLENTSLRA